MAQCQGALAQFGLSYRKPRIIYEPNLEPRFFPACVYKIDRLNVDAKPNSEAMFAANFFGLGNVPSHKNIEA